MKFPRFNSFSSSGWIHSKPFWICVLGTALLGIGMKVIAPPSNAQVGGLGGIFNNFQVPETDNLGRKSILKGASGKRLNPTQIQLTGVSLELFRSDGELELQVKAPECIYDSSAKIAYSAGPLSVETTDGRVAIKGTGFRWQLNDSRLIISNQVETVIRKGLLSPPPKTAPAGNASVAPQLAAASEAPDIIEIFSDHFDYTSDLAMFRGNVRALEPGQGELTSGLLAVTFSGNVLQKIVAEENVVITQKEGRATGNEAVYHLDQEQVIFTGNPTWQIGDAEGKSRILTLNRKTQEFRADQEVFMKAPATSFIPADLFATEPAEVESSLAGSPWIEFVAHEFSFKENTAQFRGDVQVTQPGGELKCGLLTLISASPQGPVEEIIAEENVHITQGKTEAQGRRARYLAAEDTLILTGDTRWQINQNKGSSDQLLVHPQSRSFKGFGNVSIQLPAAEAGAIGLQPADAHPLAATSNPGEPLPAMRTIEITADELEHQEYFTLFYGQVRARDARVELTSRFLTVLYAGGEAAEIEADENVRILDGDRVVTGAKAVYDLAVGTVTLTGDPELITPSGKLFSEAFILDRNQNTFRTRGNYRFEGNSSTLGQNRRKASASF